MKHDLTTPKYIIVTYFDTKLSMFGLAPTSMEEGAKAPRTAERDPKPSAGARRRGAKCPELLVE